MTDEANILVVDDTAANLRVLSGMLKDRGYKARPVPSGKLALQAARSSPPDIILLDINMPEMNGYEVCEHLKAERGLADIPVIFISALNETMDKVRAFKVGGVDYITKPFQFEEVLARVETHLTLCRYRRELERYNRDLQQLVQEQVREISHAQLATILAMSKLTESRDDDTGKHLERVQTFCRMLAERLMTVPAYAERIDVAFVENIYHASPLHDIGKVAIPDHILLKPGRLTPDEFAIMKTHTLHGANTLEAVRREYPNNAFVEMGIYIARSHHERWDGTGYPDGLAGEAIPLSAQIMAIVDVYDALRSKRCYKEAYTHERSMEIIRAASGTHLAPGVVEVFNAMEAEFHRMRDLLEDEDDSRVPALA